MRKIKYIRPIEHSSAFTYEMEDDKGKRFFTNTVTKDELMHYMKINIDAIQKTYVEELLEEMNNTMYY
jgi:hypothetical protein